MTDSGCSCGAPAVKQGRECGSNEVFLCEKFIQTFGSSLLNHDSGHDSEIRSLWWKVIPLIGKQYALLNGELPVHVL